eukprot:scaffold75485_cov79-Cyclotella_meneghiniana.AAC.4
MDFLAIASTPNKATIGSKLDAVFAKEVSIHIFENLFCSANVGWDQLGELAFVSFQNLFQSLGERISLDSAIKDRAIDALWRICISAGNEDVATNAMNDLLSLYIESNSIQPTETNEAMINQNQIKSGDLFSKKIFGCLVQVKKELQRGNNSSLRSAERCIKILKRAFDSSALGGGLSAVAERLRRTNGNDFNAYLNKIPHGLRGVSSCITASVVTKKTGGVSHRFSMEIHLLQSIGSIKSNVAKRCDNDVDMMKLSGITGRSGNNGRPPQQNFNVFPDTAITVFPDTAIAADLGISEGNELIFMLTDKAIETKQATPSPDIPSLNTPLYLGGLLDDEGEGSLFGVFFDSLIAVLESLPTLKNADLLDVSGKKTVDSHSLVWDVLLAMPTNAQVCDVVKKAASEWRASESNFSCDPMTIDSAWSSLIDISRFELSVYVLQVLDFSLQPPPHLFSCLPPEITHELTSKMRFSAQQFKSDFVRSGGFEAVLRLFVECGVAEKKARRRMRMGNEFAIRIISTCVFGEESLIPSGNDVNITKEGLGMMKTFPNVHNLLRSLMYIILDDDGVEDDVILKVLFLIDAMLRSDNIFTSRFEELPESIREKFLTSLLLWERSTTSIELATKIRKKTEVMILESPLLSSSALPFLVRAMKKLNSLGDGSDEFFSTMMKLVEAAKSHPTDDFIKNSWSENFIMDEWGEYTVQKCDVFDIRQDEGDIIEAIESNKSTVTAIQVKSLENINEVDESDTHLNGWNIGQYNENGDLVEYMFDWKRAGQAVGNSKHLRHLELHLGRFDSVQNVLLFCRGLALNGSIKSLVIDCVGQRHGRTNEEDDEILLITTMIFRELTPFFHINTSLESLQWICTFMTTLPCDLSANARRCILGSKSLKSITLRNGFLNNENFERLIEAICSKSLHHLTLYRCFLSSCACYAIKGLLCREGCLLKSLKLACFYQEASLTHIAIGLSCNKSIKCLKVRSWGKGDEEFTTPLFRAPSLGDDPSWASLEFDSLEKLELQGLDDCDDNIESSSSCAGRADLLQKMPNLKSLRVERLSSDDTILKDILANLPPNLHELKINKAIHNKRELRYLTWHLSSVTKINPKDFSLYTSSNLALRKLDLSDNGGLPLEAWTSLLKSIQVTKLEELNLLGNTQDWDTVNDPIAATNLLAAVTQLLECNKELRVLKMNHFTPVASSGWLAFSSALASHPALEILEIPNNINSDGLLRMEDRNGLNQIVRGVTLNSRLKQVWLTIDSLSQLAAILRFTKRPDCVLEELHVTCHPVRDFNTRTEDDMLTILLVDALESNSSLKIVRFRTLEFWDSLFDDDMQINYQPFCNILGNQSSIDATYNSNHSLQYLCLDRDQESEGNERGDDERDEEVPMQLYSLLHLNKGCRKHIVAITKILQFHTLKDIKFESSSVPNAISSVGNVDSKEGLSGMYEILRKMPDILPKTEKIKKKRKAFHLQ